MMFLNNYAILFKERVLLGPASPPDGTLVTETVSVPLSVLLWSVTVSPAFNEIRPCPTTSKTSPAVAEKLLLNSYASPPCVAFGLVPFTYNSNCKDVPVDGTPAT